MSERSTSELRPAPGVLDKPKGMRLNSKKPSRPTEKAVLSLCSSVSAFEAVGRRIDPSQWTQLQFGLFSVPTSGPQLVYQRPWYVLFCLWKSAYKRSLAAYRKE